MKVCILAAGKGTRNMYAQGTNKALLPIGNGTALSYIIEKFPLNTEFVIAVGHKSEQIIEAMAKYRRRVTFVYVKYEGRGVGPGHSLLRCEPYLRSPFIYMACDTLVTDEIPPPDKNWIGVSLVDEKFPYLTLAVNNGIVNKVYDKGDNDATFNASIGLVGVKDYKSFWQGLANPERLVQNEHQDTSGISALIPHGLHAINFDWYDIGTTEDYEYAHEYFSEALFERA